MLLKSTLSELNFYLICIVVTTSISGMFVSADFCANPKIAETMDVKWLHEHHAEGWNIQYGSKEGRRHTANLLLGKNSTDSENDYRGLCARVFIDISDGKCSGQFRGYKDKRGDWVCEQVQNEFKCEFHNNPNRAYEDPTKAYVSYFDGKEDHQVMAVVYCYESGGSGWHLQSRTRTISEEQKKTLLDHIKSIGYDPEEKSEMFTQSCFKK